MAVFVASGKIAIENDLMKFRALNLLPLLIWVVVYLLRPGEKLKREGKRMVETLVNERFLAIERDVSLNII